MPAYELALIMKTLPQPTLVQSIKRAAGLIYDRGG